MSPARPDREQAEKKKGDKGMKNGRMALICTVILFIMVMIIMYIKKDAGGAVKIEETVPEYEIWYVQPEEPEVDMMHYFGENGTTPVPMDSIVGGVVQKADPEAAEEAAVQEEAAEEASKEEAFIPIKECPWSKKIQERIAEICSGYGISFELVMSIAMRESDFRENLTGDCERAYGAFQIHYIEWKDLMDKLGYTLEDMYDPVMQADACCAILEGHYKECNRTTYALMAYNGGSAYAKRMMKTGKVSSYASYVKERAERWKERS